nr:hemicentin-2 isoform X2 [Nothobranchius furzeri]
MEAGLLLLLLLMLMMMGVFQAVETFCDGRQDGAQCVGALGGAVDIQLVDNAAEMPRLEWKKNGSMIVQWRSKNNTTIIRDNRVTFIPSTGTVRINNLIRDDSGQYKLQNFNSDGRSTANRTLLLSVEAGVSSVQLVSECWSQGQMQVSCSSEEGDSPQYSWTLDGHTLTDSELFSGNSQTNIIVLRQNISGRLVCSVRNRVSESSREKDISTCAEQWPVMVGVLSALAFFLVVGVAVICCQKKRQKPKEEGEEQEMTYADVRIVQQQRRQVEQCVQEEGVEYGQVRFTNRPGRSEPADNNLYAQVRKGR